MISALLIVAGLLLAALGLQILVDRPPRELDIFVGMDIGYGDEETAMKLIDEVSGYVNLIIIGSLDVTMNTENLTRVCDHMYQKGLHFIVYVGFGQGSEDAPPRGPDPQFFTNAIAKYGDKFLGVYLFDEVGGKLMDGAHSVNLTAADTHSEAAILYTHHLNYYLGIVSQYYAPAEFPLYSSDYALYWYDYVAGYDVVFTEYVGNQSRQIATGLCRGAAKALNKDWGVIITWSDRFDSFVENPEKLYDDMVLAYQNGAKYIIVFNSPGNFGAPTDFGTLTPEHFEKMEEFWHYVHTQPPVESYRADVAYVLPRDYGYGFRGSEDRIWGKWGADSLSSVVWSDAQHLLDVYVLYLDIVYETITNDYPVALPYEELIFWNHTVVRDGNFDLSVAAG